MTADDPQTRGDHPAAERFTRDRAAVHLRQLLRGQCRTKISVSFANQRQRQITIRLRQTVIARSAASLRDQAGRAPMLQTGQQSKHLAASDRATRRHPRPASGQTGRPARPRADRTPSCSSTPPAPRRRWRALVKSCPMPAGSGRFAPRNSASPDLLLGPVLIALCELPFHQRR